jgi:hypothetical protein
MDMQEILHKEFLYLFDKVMPLLPKWEKEEDSRQ